MPQINGVELFTLFVIALGLSMDAFAVSVSDGLCYSNINRKHYFYIALTFGMFQGIMTLAGCFLGSAAINIISSADHWIAFALLFAIGAKMIIDTLKENKKSSLKEKLFSVKEITVQGVATSIDALAVGISFAALKTEIISASAIIALVTFAICFIGISAGKRFGCALKQKAVIFGGIMLIITGLKILFEHILL